MGYNINDAIEKVANEKIKELLIRELGTWPYIEGTKVLKPVASDFLKKNKLVSEIDEKNSINLRFEKRIEHPKMTEEI